MNNFYNWYIKHFGHLIIIFFVCFLIIFEWSCISIYNNGPSEDQLSIAQNQIQLIHNGDFSNVDESFRAKFSKDTISLDIEFCFLTPSKEYTYNTLANRFYIENTINSQMFLYIIFIYPIFSIGLSFILLIVIPILIDFIIDCIRKRKKI